MQGKYERGPGSANADGAGAEAFAGDGCSQGASFGPMAAISRRGQGGRIYNNTRARVLQRRMCVKLADLTTHSPPKTFARPRTATHPPRALPLPHAAPPHAGRLRDAFPADLTTHSPPKASSRPRTATRPSRVLPLPHAAPTHAHAAPTHARRLRDARPPTSQHLPRRAALLPLPFRFGHKKTAPHSACAMPNVSVDRRCGRSFGLVSRALFAAVAGRWRVGVG